MAPMGRGEERGAGVNPAKDFFFLRNHYSYSTYLGYDEGLRLPGCPGWLLFLHAGQSLPLKTPPRRKENNYKLAQVT